MHDRAAGDSLDTCRPQVGRLKPARHRPICELSFLTAPFAMSSVSLWPPPAARAPVSQAATAYVQALRLEVGQWLPHALNDAVALLHESAQRVASPAQRADLAEAAAALGENLRAWSRSLERALQDAVSAEFETDHAAAPPAAPLSPFDAPAGDEEPLELSLTLMDDDEIDDEIAISRLVQIADVEAEGDLRELSALCSGLRALPGISPEAHPLRPSVVARALRRGIHAFGLRKPLRLALLRELGVAVGRALPGQYRRQLQMLQGWGITPADFALRRQEPSAAAETGPAEVAAPEQAAADTMARLLSTLASRVAMSEGARDLLRRLDAPARRIAQQEPALWQSLDHPLWQLLDRLAAAGAVHDDLDANGSLEEAVRSLETAAAPDAAQCRQALETVDGAVSGLVDLQADRVAVEAEVLHDRPPRSAIEEGLREQLRQQAAAGRAPAALERFLTGAWTEVLTDIALRHGVESTQMKSHAELVDRFVEAATRPVGRQISPATLGRMLMLARLALADAKLPHPRLEAELASLQKTLCQPAAARAEEVQAALAPFMPTMPAEAMPDTAPAPDLAGAPHDATAAAGLHDALTTVRVDTLGRDEAAARAVQAWLDSLEPGTYCRIFLLERWMNAQVVWRSDNRGMFVFKSRHGGRTHSLARRVLEKLRGAGLATTIERGEWVAQVMKELGGRHH